MGLDPTTLLTTKQRDLLSKRPFSPHPSILSQGKTMFSLTIGEGGGCQKVPIGVSFHLEEADWMMNDLKTGGCVCWMMCG
jgi:hypothetical protein